MIINRIAEKEKIREVLDMFADSLDSLSRGEEFRCMMAEKFASYADVIVLKEKGRTQAFAAFYANDLTSRMAFLSMIAVLPDHRGKGFAQCLLDAMCSEAEVRGMVRMRLEVKKDNLPAIGFYRRHHFSTVDERTDSYIMERILKENEDG